MALSKTVYMSSWKKWDGIIDAAVSEFYARYNVYPQYLEASPATHRKIDMAANCSRENIFNAEAGDLIPPDGEGFLELESFDGGDYCLEFCQNIALPEGYFRLIYDSGGDGGEPLPDDEEADALLEKCG